MTQVRLTLLGGFAARRSDGARVELPTRKAEALLAILACRAGEPQRRDRLTALLWSDRSGEQARHSLSQGLSGLRRALGDQATVFAAERETVALESTAAEIDVAEFQRLAAGDTVEDLCKAADLYRGPLLDGLKLRDAAFEEWLLLERARLRELAIVVLMNIARKQSERGDDDAAAAALSRTLALDPMAEEAYRGLIRLDLDRGCLNSAIRHYRACADILKRELDTVPEPSTTALYRQAVNRLERSEHSIAAPASDHAGHGGTDPAAADGDLSSIRGRRPSIAVMPFVDETAGDRPRGGLADGLAHDIITRLAKLRSLFVIARGTVFTLGERSIGPDEAGRMLKVDYVASGSVRRKNDRIIVTVDLAETRTARIVWADVFDERSDDTFLVLDEIGDRIVAAIATEIELLECNHAILKPPNSLDSWEAHHRGLWHMYRFNAADNDQAEHFFRMAVRLDPTFARAYAGLSFTHFQNAFLFRPGEREQEVDRAFETAGQVLIADDRDPAAHWAMGRALWLRGNLDRSLVELARAVDLSPNFALAHYQIAFVHCQSGDPRAAIDSGDYSRHLSPYDPLLFAMLATRALAEVRLGRFEDAAEWAVKAAARPNAHVHVLGIAAHCLALAGRLDEARSFATLIHKTRPDYCVDDFLSAFRFAPDAAALFRQGAKRTWLG